MKAKAASLPTCKLRIRVINPVPGCHYALQVGKKDIEQVICAAEADLSFTLDVQFRTAPDGSLDPRGPSVQGPCGARFVYINSAMPAGQIHQGWSRRAKVPLRDLAMAFVTIHDNAAPLLEASIFGRAKDNGPACASVPLLGGGWQHATDRGNR